jgi:predicted GIY-YIG superfamily endonuclease
LLHCSSKIGNPDTPYGQAQHYLGFSDQVVERVLTHKAGYGASLTRAMISQGFSLRLARVWSGGRELERKLKCYKNARKLCPICNPQTAFNLGNYFPSRSTTYATE